MSFWRTPLNCRPAEAALWPSVIPSAARNLALIFRSKIPRSKVESFDSSTLDYSTCRQSEIPPLRYAPGRNDTDSAGGRLRR